MDMDSETLLFRHRPVKTTPQPTLDEARPVHSAGAWPEGLSLRREDMYEERI